MTENWPNNQWLKLIGTKIPIVQAPMAGANDAAMVIAVSNAGALGSLPCAMLNTDTARAQLHAITRGTDNPYNLNFFCHTPESRDMARQASWQKRLAGYYQQFGLDINAITSGPARSPFDEDMCVLVEEFRPRVVSFHFGLPDIKLVERVKSTGCTVLSTATTAQEAVWLEQHGCDAIIAQGFEAGGHRGMFLSDDLTTQVGTMALVPQIVDAVKLPVIAAGGITDGRGIAAAFALGAAGVQLGTAYLLTTESRISTLHREALAGAGSNSTALTNLFSGKPARGLMNRLMREQGPIYEQAPVFPTAGEALTPLKAQAEKTGSTDFSSLWAGQAASLAREADACTLTQQLARDAQTIIGSRQV